MALAAQSTSTIRLGPFLAVPSNRSAATTAQGVATVNRLAPGRVFLALGTGYTSRNTFGLPALPAARLKDYARQCRVLLDGGVAEYHEGEHVRNIEFADRRCDYIDLEQRIPVYVAGDGPKALAAVGEAGDGWVTTLQRANVMGNAAEVFSDSLAAVRASAQAAGRSAEEYSLWSNTLCVLEPGERPTSPRVLRARRGLRDDAVPLLGRRSADRRAPAAAGRRAARALRARGPRQLSRAVQQSATASPIAATYRTCSRARRRS
jgi:5,10-methylenetetrahydromethanopterin reductase